MSENKPASKKTFSPDWWVRGVLTRVGDTLDKFTGRNWKPSSSLATSEIIARLKKLLDAEVRDAGEKGKFVPHHIQLKMQWDKFSTDETDGLKRLENELLIAAADYINDNRYHTYAPLKIEAKSDYFTDGVRLSASFGDTIADEREAEMKVTMPQANINHLIPPKDESAPETDNFVAEFTTSGKPHSAELKFTKGARLSVGRTRENNLTLDDTSVSKIHAILAVNAENKLLVADTGSTNGTFVAGQRIAYGRALAIAENDTVKFGNVNVSFRRAPEKAEFVAPPDAETNGETEKDFPAAGEIEAATNATNVESKND